MNPIDQSAATLNARILKKGAIKAFDEFGITAIPSSWFETGIVIINNTLRGSQPPIGHVLLRKLVNAGVMVKVITISKSKDPGHAVVSLVDSKIRLGLTSNVSRNHNGEKGLFPAATEGDLTQMPVFGCLNYNLRYDGVCLEEIVITTAYAAMATHLADGIQALSLVDRIKVAGCVALVPLVTKQSQKANPNEIKVVPQNQRARSYGEATFTFHSETSCCVTTSRERWCNAHMDLNGKIYDGSTILCLLIMSMVSERLVSQRQIDGWLSALSNIWAREDNYGAPLQEDDVLAYIIRNSHKSVSANPCIANDQRYPHFALGNAPFNISVMDNYLEQGLAVMPDKVAAERCAFGDGARAMMMDHMTAGEAASELAGFADWATKNLVQADDHLIVMPHDVAKGEAKLFNRPGQAFGANFGDSWSDLYPLVTTALRMDTSDAAMPAIFRGFEMQAVISNSLFGHGSGACCARPGFSRPVAVAKKLSGSVMAINFPGLWQNSLLEMAASKGSSDWIEEFIPTLEAKCATLVGQYFNYGDDVLTLWPNDDMYRRTIISMADFNQSVKVTGFKVTRLGTSETLQVVLDTVLEYADNGIKWRGPGAKATTVIENISFSDDHINENWELMFPYEALKGRLLQVFMYSNAMEDAGYSCLYSRGKIYCGKGGELIVSDLSTMKSHFEDWVKATTKLVTLTRIVAKSHYHRVLASNGGVLPHIEIKGDSWDCHGKDGGAGAYVIEEQVQCLFGRVHLQVEVSTPREATGAQSMLLEGIATLSSLDMMSGRAGWPENIGGKFWTASAEYRQGIVAAVQMTLGAKEGAVLLGTKDYEVFKSMVYGKKLRSGRDLMREVAKRFPDGIIVHTSNQSVCNTYINAGAFLQLGSFGTGGTATGIALDVTELVHYMATEPANRIVSFDSFIHGLNSKVKAGLETWMGQGVGSGTVDAKSVLKRLGRTNKIEVGGKIQTTFSPICEHHFFIDEEGVERYIPTVVLHPDCDIVKLNGVSEGDVIGMKRTPMISPVFCRVKISAEEGLIAYVRMLPEVWAEGNEGDTDGDGCCDFVLDKEVSYAWSSKFNESLFSSNGYWYLYGSEENHPFAEFVSVKDAWNKKLISDAEGLVPQSILDHFGGKVKAPSAILQIKTGDYMVDAAKKVSDHYKFKVGTAYGWCSIITFKVSELIFKLALDIFTRGITNLEEGGLGLDQVQAVALYNEILTGNFDSLDEGLKEVIIPRYNAVIYHMQASVVIWRYCYEGLGLGGYSAAATAFFKAVGIAARPTSKFMVADMSYMGEDTLVVDCAPPNLEGAVTVVPIDVFLKNHFDLLQDKSPEVLRIIVEAELLRKTYSNAEQDGVDEEASSNALLNEAMLLGGLRRTTQGTTNVTIDYTSNGTSTFSHIAKNGLSMNHPILSDALAVAGMVHNHLDALAQARLDA
jgi:hypothetical protein